MAYCKYSPSDLQAHDAGSSQQSNRRMSQPRAMVSSFAKSSSFSSLALVQLISLLSLVLVPVIFILSLVLLLIILA